jgi:hypothetical protein
LFCEFENAKQGRRKKTFLGVLLELVAWGDDVWTRVLLPSLFSLFCVPSVRPLFVLCLSALSLCPLFPPLFWVLSLSFFFAFLSFCPPCSLPSFFFYRVKLRSLSPRINISLPVCSAFDGLKASTVLPLLDC